jgi:hypothetical protein
VRCRGNHEEEEEAAAAGGKMQDAGTRRTFRLIEDKLQGSYDRREIEEIKPMSNTF